MGPPEEGTFVLNTVGLIFGRTRQLGWLWSKQDLPEQRYVGAGQFLIWLSDPCVDSCAIPIVISVCGSFPLPRDMPMSERKESAGVEPGVWATTLDFLPPTG